jgi:hypothetical protein
MLHLPEGTKVTDNREPGDRGNQKVRALRLGFGSVDCSKCQLSLRERDYRRTRDQPYNSDTKYRSA